MKRKLLAVYLVVAILLQMFVPLAALAEEPRSFYIAGLKSGETYYIKNEYDGKYLSVASSTDANGTNVCTLSMSQAATQKWRIVLNANSTYTLYAVFSSNNRVLNHDTSTNNINIWQYNSGSTAQKFTIIRKTSSVYAGLYRIKIGNKYVALTASGDNIAAVSSPSQKRSHWSFIPCEKQDADIFVFNINGDINTSGCAKKFTSKCNSMGYTPYAFINKAASVAYNYMQYDSIWVFNGHGLKNQDGPCATIVFCSANGSWQGKIKAGPSLGSTEYSINDLPNNSLASERLVLYIGCSTGVSYNGYNLIDKTFEKGAHFALGTTQSIYPKDSVKWIKAFFTRAAKGYTIQQCIDYANYKVSLGTLYYKGDSSATLKY